MHIVLTLLRKDITNFLRNRTALTLTFIIPIVLIYIFGQVFGLNRKDTGPSGIRLAVVNQSANPGGQKLVDALKAETAFRIVSHLDLPDRTRRPLTEADARRMIHDRELRFALLIPADLIPPHGLGLRLKVLSDPRNTIETQMVSGLLQRTIFSSVPELIGNSLQTRAREFVGDTRMERFNTTLAETIASTFGGDKDEIQRRIAAGDLGLSGLPGATKSANPDASSAAGTRNPLSDFVKIENEQVVGKDVKSPEATRIIGGQAIMFLLFAVSGASAAFFDEKNAGLFQRLLSAPLSRGQLLWSRFAFGMLIGLLQLTTLFAAGSLMYNIDVLGHLIPLLVVCCAAAAACSSFGMLIAALAPNAQAASGLATFVVMMMSATGGAWFPLTLMPEFMQQIGKFTLVYWSIEGFLQVLWAGNSLLQVLPIVGILSGIAAVVMTFSIWRLNRKRIFE
jgi:ABC-2 type transport system permease protein